MGNSADDGEFFTHYSFLIKQLFELTLPGRLSAVHCSDLPKTISGKIRRVELRGQEKGRSDGVARNEREFLEGRR
jgi:acyl-coenzyme A synthetase/AMP-(fatty) acid ligase